MIDKIPFPELLEDLKIYAETVYREMQNEKALRIYNRCLKLGRYQRAEKILAKYGKRIDEISKSDMAMSMAHFLYAQKITQNKTNETPFNDSNTNIIT